MRHKAAVEVYFNKPRRPLAVEPLLADIRTAQVRLCVCAAWLTNSNLAQAVMAAPAPRKVLLLNGADMADGATSGAYKALHAYFLDPSRWRPQRDSGIFVIGNTVDGLMHHKLVLVDQVTVWTGSYNLTFGAARNYENLLRITSGEVAQVYWAEVDALIAEEQLYGAGATEIINGAYRCQRCNRLCAVAELRSTALLCGTCQDALHAS